MHGEKERRKTPLYIVLSNEGRTRSIQLIPLQFNGHLTAGQATSSTQGSSSVSTGSSNEAQMIVDGDLSDSSKSSIDQVWPDREFHHPKVLISLSLEEDQRRNVNEWVEWMRSIPAFVKYTNVDAIYKSGSTLILLTVPVAIWDLLPESPAIAFIGFTDSWNLLRSSLPSSVESQVLTKAKGEPPSSVTPWYRRFTQNMTSDHEVMPQKYLGLCTPSNEFHVSLDPCDR